MARPCMYKGGPRGEWVHGIFHRWGDGWAYGNGDDRLPYTTAIIEDWDDGEVHSIEPNHVRFLPTPEHLDVSDEAVRIRTRLAQAEK